MIIDLQQNFPNSQYNYFSAKKIERNKEKRSEQRAPHTHAEGRERERRGVVWSSETGRIRWRDGREGTKNVSSQDLYASFKRFSTEKEKDKYFF